MTESTAAPSPPDLFLSGTPRGRRSFSSSSSSSFSSSSFSSFPSDAVTPFASPSPRHFAVPFSWERRPGIPKAPKVSSAAAAAAVAAGRRLPLPPLFRSHSDLSSRYRTNRSSRLYATDDPFAVALHNCAAGLTASAVNGGDEMRNARWRRGVFAGRFGFGFRRFYGSTCKAASSVATAEATVRVRRAGSDRGRVELVRLNVDSRSGVYPGPN